MRYIVRRRTRRYDFQIFGRRLYRRNDRTDGIHISRFYQKKGKLVFPENVTPESVVKESKSKMKHWYVGCRFDNKKPQILELLCLKMKFKQAIVFVSRESRKNNHYGDELEKIGRTGPIGKITYTTNSEERRRIVQSFNKNEIKVLICHDIPLFGINTSNVQVVVHADLPTMANPMDIYDKR
eukprot:UN25337